MASGNWNSNDRDRTKAELEFLKEFIRKLEDIDNGINALGQIQLSNIFVKVKYSELIDISTGTSGSLANVPPSATITQGGFGEAGNAVLSTVTSQGTPSFVSPQNGASQTITADVDTSGNWVVSDIFIDPVFIIYEFTISLANYGSEVDENSIVEFYLNTLQASDVIYDNTGSQLTSGDVQAAIDELALEISQFGVDQATFFAIGPTLPITLTGDNQTALITLDGNVRQTDPLVYNLIAPTEVEILRDNLYFVQGKVAYDAGNNRTNGEALIEISVDAGVNWVPISASRAYAYTRNEANDLASMTGPLIPFDLVAGNRLRLVWNQINTDGTISSTTIAGESSLLVIERTESDSDQDPPQILLGPDNPTEVDQFDNYQFQPVASGLQKIWSLNNEPTEMTIDPISGFINYQANTAFSGVVDLIATNGGGSDTYQFQLDVINNPGIRPTIQYLFEADRLIGFNNNEPVPALTDFSGNSGSTPSQTNPGFQGTYQVNVLGPSNNLPVINFNNAFYRGVFDQVRSDEAFTVVFYARVANESVTGTLLNFFSGALNIHEINYQATDDVRWRINATAGLTHANEDTGSFRCLVFRYDPSGTGSGNDARRQIYINAANNRVASSSGPASLADSQNYSIGSTQEVSDILSGDIAYIAMYDEAIPVNEIQGVIQQVRQKWDT